MHPKFSTNLPLLLAAVSSLSTLTFPAEAKSGIQIKFDPCFQQISISASQTLPAAVIAELSSRLNIPIRFDSTHTELRDYYLEGDLREIITGILGHTNYAARNEFDPNCGAPRVTQLWIFSDSTATPPEERVSLQVDENKIHESKHISSVADIPEPIIVKKPAGMSEIRRSDQPLATRRAMDEAEKGKRNGRASNGNNTQ